MKRKIALGFLVAILATVVGAVVLLETPWAGDRVCALAHARVRSAIGHEVAFSACRIDPLRLEVSVRDVRVGPTAAPIFAADAIRVRLAPVQPLGRRLSLAEVVALRPRLVAEVPPARADAPREACPPPALEAFEVKRLRVEGGSTQLRLPGGERLVVERIDVRSVPPAARRRLDALTAPVARRAGFEIALAGARLEARDRTAALDEARLVADLALDLSRLDVRLFTADLSGGAKVAAAGAVLDLCHPRLDLGVSAQVDLPALLAMVGRPDLSSEGRIAVDLALRGPASAPDAAGEVRLAGTSIDGWRPGDATARLELHGDELKVDRLEVPMQGGAVSASGTLRWTSPSSTLHPGGGGSARRVVELKAEASLRDVELGALFARLKLPRAWVTMRVNGRTSAAGTVVPLRLAGQADLDFADFRVQDRPWDAPPPPDGPILALRRGHVAGAVQIDPAGVRIERAQVRAGAGALAARGMLNFSVQRGFEIATEGVVDLAELGHVGPVPLGGMAQLEGGLVRAAPYGNPHVEGLLRVKDLRFLQLDLGEAAASLAYDAFVLRVAGAEGLRGATRYAGAARVDLHAHPPAVLDGEWVAQGKLRDLFEAAMPWKADARILRDALDGDVVVRGTLAGPAAAPDAEFRGELGRGRLLGRAFDSGLFAGRIERGGRAVFEAAELRRAGGVARASGTLGFTAPFPWELEGTFSGVRLADLSFPGSAWAGTASGAAAVSGSLRDPRVRLDATGEGVAVEGVPVGSLELHGTLDGAALALSARAGGVRLAGTAHLSGAMPFEARADLDVRELTRFLPGASAGLRASARGSAVASGSLAELARARAEVRLEVVRGGYGEFQVENEAPLALSVDGGRVVLHPLTLRGANTRFTLGGVREATGELDLDARGALDLRILGGVVPGVTATRGQLALEAHVAGTLGEPTLVGSGTLRDAGCQLRDAPIAFSGIAGDLTFSHNRVLFDRLDAQVNGGRAELQGEIELARFLPARVRVGLVADEVPVRIPEYLPAVVSGQLLASGTWDAMLLSGRLHVVRALYGEPVDLEKRVLEVGKKKPPPKPPARGGEWLGFDLTLLVDGDVRIENDLVRGAARGELTLTGTLAGYGLIGTITMGEGSRATFRGNEFVLSNAVAEFTDRRSVHLSLDVHGDAVVRDYQVFMRLYGPYESPTLTLTSEPALSQPDIVTLLSLGYTSRDAPSSAAVSGAAAAAAAQALFSASGLDEQVRRFVPRSRLLRDFSVRMTTAYSEATGQIEPRAEFESKVLDDRMRLRYQAPISAARGQRAQAELRLSEHTSLQYQWDNDNSDVAAVAGGDHGLDLKLRWEWTD